MNMKRLLPLVAVMLCSSAVLPAAELRQNINVNREWKFQLGDVAGADASTFDDSKWDAANLPHSFSMPYFAADRFYVGYGWYRKHFEVPAAWSGQRVGLEFDGVFQVAEVFVNGRRIGEHKGGYTGFTFDITDAVKTGDNVVAVRVNNNWDARLAPRAGEHTFSGGIYRNVRLVVTAPVHVHHPAGVQGIRHSECEDGGRERIGGGEIGHAQNQRGGREGKDRRAHGIQKNHPAWGYQHL
jgi:beta-galactosidase